MKKIILTLKILQRHIYYDKNILLFVFIVMIMIFGTMRFVINTAVQETVLEFGSIADMKRAYTVDLNVARSMAELEEILNIFSGYKLKKADKVRISLDYIFANAVDEAIYDTKRERKISGRDFLLSEIQGGEFVIILSREDYLCYFSDYHENDYIALGGVEFKLIGISNEIKRTEIPLRSLFRETVIHNTKFHVNEIDVTLEEPLTFYESFLIKRLYNKRVSALLQNKKGRYIDIQADLEAAIISIYNNLRDYAIAIILLFIILFICSVQTYTIIYYKNFEYKFVYALFGKEEVLKEILIMEILGTMGASILAGLVVL